MELIAGPAPEIMEVAGGDDRAAAGRRQPVPGLPVAERRDGPDLARPVRRGGPGRTERDVPSDFIDARIELGPTVDAGPTVERVDPGWIMAVAAIPDVALDGVAGRWIDRLEEELGALPREEKPWIRELVARMVGFCRTADRAPDVVFVWEL